MGDVHCAVAKDRYYTHCEDSKTAADVALSSLLVYKPWIALLVGTVDATAGGMGDLDRAEAEAAERVGCWRRTECLRLMRAIWSQDYSMRRRMCLNAASE